MNAAEARKYLAAYADGELEPALRDAVEGYLATDPAAVEEVRRWRALRAATWRALENEPVPAGLAERVRARLRTERAGGMRTYLQRRAIRLGLSGVAAAAAVVLAFTLWPRTAAATPVDARGFARIYRTCAVTHRHDALGVRGVTACDVAPKIRQCTGFGCWLPDLTRCGRYHVDGACQCSPAKTVRVVHTYFQSDDAPTRVVSVFAVDRRIRLDTGGDVCPTCRGSQREYRASTDGGVNIIAWNEPERAYVLVGALPQADLLRLADELEVARGPQIPDYTTVALAELTMARSVLTAD